MARGDLWPTPLARDSRGPTQGARAQGSPPLSQAVRTMLPTPIAADATTGARTRGDSPGTGTGLRAAVQAIYHTPTASRTGDWTQDGKTGQRRLSLQGQARRYPTPTASEDKYRLGGNTQQSKSLGAIAAREGRADGSGGQLNPTWVEWLMGFPPGWTDCGPSETRSCRKSSSRSARG
jgi:hypothetical protein